MRSTCLSCGANLVILPSIRHWRACPVCEAAWLREITITLPDMNRTLGGDLLQAKGRPFRNGKQA